MSVQMTHKKIGVGYSGSGVIVDGYEAPNVGVGTELRYNTVYSINQVFHRLTTTSTKPKYINDPW